MKRIICCAMTVLTLAVMAAPSGALTPIHQWSKRFGGTGYDYGFATAVDDSGNVFITGSFAGTVNFGGGNLVSAGLLDVFLAKYNSAGVYQWSRRFGGTQGDDGQAIAVDASGNVFVAGSFQGTANFGGSNLVSAGTYDIFVAKYSGNGVHQWSHGYGTTNGEFAYGVAADPSGNVFVTGYFTGTLDLGSGGLTSNGSNDVFVAKYDASGAPLWSNHYGSVNEDEGYSVASDASGNVVVTGRVGQAVDFGGGSLTYGGGFYDAFVAKFDGSGVHQWSKDLGSTGTDIGNWVTTDGAGNVVVTGHFAGTVNFGGGGLSSAGSDDIFVARYDAAGTHQWSRRFGGTLSDAGNSVAVDDAGNVVVTGSFQGTVDFGGGNVVSHGSDDVFVAKLTAAGKPWWSRGAGGTSSDIGYAVATDASGNVFTTGVFQGTANFGGTDLVSAGYDDIFLVKYAGERAEPFVTAITDIGNDQGRQVKIRFGRSWYDQAGSATPVLSYEVYRRDDPPPAAAGVAHDPSGLSPAGLLANGWTFVGSAPAHEESTYGLDVPTIGDSTIAYGPYESVFYVRAATADPGVFFDSPADSGYSVDNLAPSAPVNLVYSTGQLSWDPSTAKDFDYFTVYGSNTDSFGSATVVNYSVSPAMDVTASSYVFYYVTATDFSGNEGKPARINTLSGVGAAPASYVLSLGNYPNPFNPATTVRYTVPVHGAVTILIYDARGARIATLLDHEVRDPGAYTAEWKGLSDSGTPASSGIYFVKIEQNGSTRSRKMVLLK